MVLPKLNEDGRAAGIEGAFIEAIGEDIDLVFSYAGLEQLFDEILNLLSGQLIHVTPNDPALTRAGRDALIIQPGETAGRGPRRVQRKS